MSCRPLRHAWDVTFVDVQCEQSALPRPISVDHDVINFGGVHLPVEYAGAIILAHVIATGCLFERGTGYTVRVDQSKDGIPISSLRAELPATVGWWTPLVHLLRSTTSFSVSTLSFDSAAAVDVSKHSKVSRYHTDVLIWRHGAC